MSSPLPSEFIWRKCRSSGMVHIDEREEWVGAVWEICRPAPLANKPDHYENIGRIEATGRCFRYSCTVYSDLFGRESFEHVMTLSEAGAEVIRRYLESETERIAGKVERALEQDRPEISEVK